MKKRISILTSGHPPFDERIYWKFSKTLVKNNFDVGIFCSTHETENHETGLFIKGFNGNYLSKRKKLANFYFELKNYSPDIIICCEPLTILPAYRFKHKYNKKCKIVSDITEWYPENVANKSKGIKKFVIYLILYALNIILTNLADALIIGETNKVKRYNLISPFKKKTIIGYYPVLEFFKYYQPDFDGITLTICYAGLVNFGRGVLTLIEVAEKLAMRHPSMKIRVKIIGKFQYLIEERAFEEIIKKKTSINFDICGWTGYDNISELMGDADICFDLREKNFIYKNSLPIKLFEYMACGKPFIFTDINPIRIELGDLNCGFLVSPENIEEIIGKIEIYISNKELLKSHSINGRKAIENGRNWEQESNKLISLLDKLIHS